MRMQVGGGKSVVDYSMVPIGAALLLSVMPHMEAEGLRLHSLLMDLVNIQEIGHVAVTDPSYIGIGSKEIDLA